MLIVCCFDVGSGSLKCLVARVDEGGAIAELWGDEIEMYAKRDCETNNNRLSADFERLLSSGLVSLKERALRSGATRFFGIATAVFRTALNGSEVIERAGRDHAIELSVVSQVEEGLLGLLTAAAVAGLDAKRVVSWDSGGASFQLSMLGAGGGSGDVEVFQGPWGSVNSLSELLSLRGQRIERGVTPNPVTRAEADLLVSRLKAKFPETGLEGIRTALRTGHSLITVGGPTSVFNMVKIFCNGVAASNHTEEDARRALEWALGKTDEQIVQAGYPQPELLVPKLCLFIAVMESLGIPALIGQYFPCVGSCQGAIQRALL
jgi:exopolyphosphatase/pppGpp-phosphohydrolase